jgi:hypothetical protein
MTTASEKVLTKLYKNCGLSVDSLPYTKTFDLMYHEFRNQTGTEVTRNELYAALTNLRKRGSLPTKRKAKEKV